MTYAIWAKDLQPAPPELNGWFYCKLVHSALDALDALLECRRLGFACRIERYRA